MVKTLVGALALVALPSVFAFRDTSPFFLFSTADLSINGKDTTIAQSSRIQSDVLNTLVKCPTKTYIVVSQQGVSSADYLDDLYAPRLGYFMGGQHPDIKTTMAVSEVVGDVDSGTISDYLQADCGAVLAQDNPSKSMKPRSAYSEDQLVFHVMLATPKTQERSADLDKHDALLEKMIADLDTSDYTVIYTTTAQTDAELEATLRKGHTYEMESPFDEAVHMELKRDTVAHQNRKTKAKEGALFERYQYLSPGLFMGITAMIPLVVILYVGLTAITNLEVSYFAFSKEMGPAAQRNLKAQ